MKRLILLSVYALSLNLYGQGEKMKKEIQLETGFLFHWNTMNYDGYLDELSPSGSANATGLTGIDLRLSIPTKTNYLDLVFGTLIEKGWDDYSTSSSDYRLNGGGVYAGLSPKIKSKHIGLTSLFAIGVLSYKEYFYSTTAVPGNIIEEKKSSFGLGAISSVGVYGRWGPIGINPQAQAVFSGGNNASFLFYGFVIPLTIEF